MCVRDSISASRHGYPAISAKRGYRFVGAAADAIPFQQEAAVVIASGAVQKMTAITLVQPVRGSSLTVLAYRGAWRGNGKVGLLR